MWLGFNHVHYVRHAFSASALCSLWPCRRREELTKAQVSHHIKWLLATNGFDKFAHSAIKYFSFSQTSIVHSAFKPSIKSIRMFAIELDWLLRLCCCCCTVSDFLSNCSSSVQPDSLHRTQGQLHTAQKAGTERDFSNSAEMHVWVPWAERWIPVGWNSCSIFICVERSIFSGPAAPSYTR